MSPSPVPSPSPSSSRLLVLLDDMRETGYTTRRSQAIRMGLPEEDLRSYVAGVPMPAHVARDVEWMMDLPIGWLDGGLMFKKAAR